ncbi:MAG TPA: prolyl oligopeptidase family serine peptidase, partial [Polyangia bacterium]
VAWVTPTRITYTLMDLTGRDRLQNMRAYVADATGGSPIPVLGAGVPGAPTMDPAEFPVIDHEGNGDWVVGAAEAARMNDRFFVARRVDLAAGKPAWREIASLDDEVSDVAEGTNALYLLTTKHDPNGSIERLDPATLKREPIRTPAGIVLTDVAATRDGIYVAGYTDGVGRLFFVPGGRGSGREIKLPFEASFVGLYSSLAPTVDGRGVLFALTGWTMAPRSFRVEGGRLTSLGLDSAGWVRARGFQVRRDEAVSADGTRVPMAVVSPQGKGPWPTILQAYGAYGIPTARPAYNAFRLSWTGGGGAMAYCGVRGGNERGRPWQDGGRLANKPNGHADYIACAQRLIETGVARPGGIAATGGSAGGLMAPVAVQKRPELFGALLPRVATLNPSRNEAGPNGANQYTEMGDPRTAEGYRALVAQDAYLSLSTAKDLPDTLLTVGLNDSRVPPWMTAKFAAGALDRFGDRRLVFVRADAEQGHGLGSARDAQIAEYADAYAFATDRLEKHAR